MPTAHLSGDLTSEDVARLAEHFEPLRAEELVEFAAERFGARMVLTCSWQMGTSILVHMTREVAPQTRLVEIDTGLLFAESTRHAQASWMTTGSRSRPCGRCRASRSRRPRTARRSGSASPIAAVGCARWLLSSRRSGTPTAG